MSASPAPFTPAEDAVLIGIPTFRRPQDLQRLLSALPAVIDVAKRSEPGRRVDVLVVDNDSGHSARSVAESAAVAPRYVTESQPGVAAVRNRILDESADYGTLVFIDDDETPASDDWLASLLRARDEMDADLVAAGVKTVVEGEMDPWVEAGGFFARTHRAGLITGDPIEQAATNNLLLDLGFVRSSGVRFDERFGRSGGEDSLFTSMLRRKGARMFWCADAPVVDHLAPERRSREHALSRTRRMASSGVRVSLTLARSMPASGLVRLRAVAVGGMRILAGGLRVGVARIGRSVRHHAVGHRDLARGIGGIEGALGRVHAHYGEAAPIGSLAPKGL